MALEAPADRDRPRTRDRQQVARSTTPEWDSAPGLGAAAISAGAEVIGAGVAAIGDIPAGDGAGVAGVGDLAGVGGSAGDGIPSGIGPRTGMSHGGATDILTPTFMRILNPEEQS
jgi:hypothetical protein